MISSRVAQGKVKEQSLAKVANEHLYRPSQRSSFVSAQDRGCIANLFVYLRVVLSARHSGSRSEGWGQTKFRYRKGHGARIWRDRNQYQKK